MYNYVASRGCRAPIPVAHQIKRKFFGSSGSKLGDTFDEYIEFLIDDDSKVYKMVGSDICIELV